MGRLTQVVRVHNWQVCEFGGLSPSIYPSFVSIDCYLKRSN